MGSETNGSSERELNLESEYVHVPFGDSGKGMYGKMFGHISKYLGFPFIEKLGRLATSVPCSQNEEVFTIGEYGTADGSASMELIRSLLLVLKEHHGEDKQFQIIYEDQPVNDFSSLFKRLSGIIPDPPSYLLDMDNVFTVASGTSFYQQCVPSSSMHVILSMTAVHWLSKRPVAYQNSIFCFPDTSEQEKELLRKQAKADWEKFLLLRAKELKPGGIMMLVVPSQPEEADTNWAVRINSALSIMSDLWKQFRDEDIITEKEFVNTNLDMCYYTVTQMKEPFNSGEETQVMKAHLRLISIETIVSDLEVLKAWRRKTELDGKEDRASFAKSLAAIHRSYSNSAFLGGLSKLRSSDERSKIVDLFFCELEHKFTQIHPEYFKNDIRFAYLFLEKMKKN